MQATVQTSQLSGSQASREASPASIQGISCNKKMEVGKCISSVFVSSFALQSCVRVLSVGKDNSYSLMRSSSYSNADSEIFTDSIQVQASEVA